MKHRIEPKLKKESNLSHYKVTSKHCNRLPATKYTPGTTITIIQQPLTSCVRRRRRTDAIRRSLAITLHLAPSPTKSSFNHINRERTRKRRMDEEQKTVASWMIVKEMMERGCDIGQPAAMVQGLRSGEKSSHFFSGFCRREEKKSASLPPAFFFLFFY